MRKINNQDLDNWSEIDLEDWTIIDLEDWTSIDLEDWKLPKLNWTIKDLELFNVR
jgi:hypothetical protein